MPVNLSNDIYFELKRIKEKQGRSFSEVISELLAVNKTKNVQKTKGTKEMLEFIASIEKATSTKAPKVDYSKLIDEIAYG